MIAVTEVKRKILDYWESNPTHATAVKTAFITALRDCGIVRRACETAQIDRPTVYLWRQTDEAFRKAWEEALEDAVDVAEGSLYDLAISGKNVVATIFYLKNNREKYREETRIILAKEDLDHVIQAAITEHRLPAIEVAATMIEASSGNQQLSSSSEAGPAAPTSE